MASLVPTHKIDGIFSQLQRTAIFSKNYEAWRTFHALLEPNASGFVEMKEGPQMAAFS